MAQNKSPDGSYPDFPFVLPVDGEGVTEDKLCVSPTTGLGWIGKLIDAVGYLYARTPQLVVVTLDGAGNIATNRRTPLADGTSHLFSSIAVSGVNVTLTFSTAFASDRDFAAFIAGTYSIPQDRFAYIAQTTTTSITVRVWDISSGADVDLTAAPFEFNLAVFPHLAGMT